MDFMLICKNNLEKGSKPLDLKVDTVFVSLDVLKWKTVNKKNITYLDNSNVL